jgi:hypothetical protein
MQSYLFSFLCISGSDQKKNFNSRTTKNREEQWIYASILHLEPNILALEKNVSSMRTLTNTASIQIDRRRCVIIHCKKVDKASNSWGKNKTCDTCKSFHT